MSEHNSDDMDKHIASLVAQASETKVIRATESNKLVKKPDPAKVPDLRKKVQKMQKDGFNTEQIAAALGFDEAKIAYLIEERVELGTPEQILQESLMTLASLVPLADATYREHPSSQNAMALTGIIDSVKGLVTDMYQLKDKEEIYRVIIQKVMQPTIRNMISDMLTEFKHLNKNAMENPEKTADHIQNTATAIGKKFDEAYRKSADILAGIIGINADAKARVLGSRS